MSKFLFKILFLIGCTAISSAMICTPTFCDKIKCQEDVNEENCKGLNKIFIPEGSLCGCCPVCITLSIPIPQVTTSSGDGYRLKLKQQPLFGTEDQAYYQFIDSV